MPSGWPRGTGVKPAPLDLRRPEETGVESRPRVPRLLYRGWGGYELASRVAPHLTSTVPRI